MVWWWWGRGLRLSPEPLGRQLIPRHARHVLPQLLGGYLMIKQVIAEEREVGLVVIEEGLREGLEVGPRASSPSGSSFLASRAIWGMAFSSSSQSLTTRARRACLRRAGWPWLFYGPRRSWRPPAGGGLFVVFSGSSGSGGGFPTHRPS